MQVDLIKLGTEIVTGSSILHTLLPPWEVFNDFPTVQKYYKILVYFLGYAALNGRSTVYGSVSTKDGTKPSDAVAKTQAPTAPPNPPTGG